MSDKSSTIFWKDGDGCHWCLRKATSITEGHDGHCPVPYAAQLEAENEALHILRDIVKWSIKPHRERYQEGTMKCELCEAWEKYSRKIALTTGEDDESK